MEADPLIGGLRSAIGLVGFPVPADTERLLDHLQEDLVVEYTDVLIPYYLPLPDGRGIITIPRSLPGDERLVMLLEEVAHHFVRKERPSPEPAQASGNGGNGGDVGAKGGQRLALLWDDREERGVREWILAWKLPEEEVLACFDDEELARESGCSLAEIQERRGYL